MNRSLRSGSLSRPSSGLLSGSRAARRVLGLGVACLALAGCPEGGDPAREARPAERRCVPAAGAGDPPHVVLVVLCTFRYSHMSGAGYPRPTTPFLDSLAERGLSFRHAMSASSWTKPAVASLLTGLTPNLHGLVDFHDPREVERGRVPVRRVLPDEILTLAECLRDVGYRTAGRSNNVHVSHYFELQQGFDDFVADRNLTAAGMVNELGRWLRDWSGKPFFYLLVARDAHITYRPHYEYYRAFDRIGSLVTREAYPAYARDVWRRVKAAVERGEPVEDEWKVRFVDLYDAELRQLDDALRRLPAVLHRAGAAERTVLVVTADHGERFFERDDVGHGARLDLRTLRTPLLLSGPGLPSGAERADLARSIDVFPTLAALAGAAPPEPLPGRDLLAAAGPGPFPGAAESAFASFEGAEHMVRSGPFTYYQRAGGEQELYDLERDPGELRSLAERDPERVRWLAGSLERWLAFEGAAGAGRAATPLRELPSEAVRELRELGYLEGED